MDLGTTVEHTLHRQTLFALRLAKRPGEVHSKPACHADRPGRAGVANADRESKLVGMPVPWTCDLDRTSRSCRVFCSLQCMACVHWSTQATAAALVHRQMAMRPLWRRSNAEEGHRHWAALCSGELTHTYSGKKDAPPPPLLVTTPYVWKRRVGRRQLASASAMPIDVPMNPMMDMMVNGALPTPMATQEITP